MDRPVGAIEVYDELGDFSGTLGDLAGRVQKLIEKYGDEATITFDAGYNNVDAFVVPHE